MFDDLGIVIMFGFFGFFVAAATVVIGIPLGVWWLIHHVSFH